MASTPRRRVNTVWKTLSTTFTPGTTTQVQIGTYPVTAAPIAKYYGAVPLKPEKSTNLSAGLVLTPMQDLLVTLDGYSIKVKNRIGISQNFDVTQADINKLAALAYVGAGGTVQYFTNGFDTKTKGVDLVATYAFHLGDIGRLDTTVAYNYNKTERDQVHLDRNQLRRASSTSTHYAPNNRVNFTAAYSIAKLKATLHENYATAHIAMRMTIPASCSRPSTQLTSICLTASGITSMWASAARISSMPCRMWSMASAR